MVADGREFITTAWWVPVMPGAAIFLTVSIRLQLQFLKVTGCETTTGSAVAADSLTVQSGPIRSDSFILQVLFRNPARLQRVN